MLTAHETGEITAANASDRQPVVFIHGLWLLSSSWDRWRQLFEERGYATVAPSWPDDPDTVEEARSHPEVFAGKMVQRVTDHYHEAVTQLHRKPALVGHSFGGLIAQKLAGEGVSAATVAIDPAPFRGVLPVPASSLKSSLAVLSNPANRGRAIALTFDQFRYGWANALDESEARDLYDTFHVPAAGAPIFQAVAANLNPFIETKVDTSNAGRGPLLIIGGEKDHTVPLALTRSQFKHQQKNSGVTGAWSFPTVAIRWSSTMAGPRSPRPRLSSSQHTHLPNLAARRRTQGQPAAENLPLEEPQHAHNHHGRWRGNLLQGLGSGTAHRVQPRLAAVSR